MISIKNEDFEKNTLREQIKFLVNAFQNINLIMLSYEAQLREDERK